MGEHDNSYKLLFSHARMMEDLLRGFVQEAWVEQIDFTTLDRMSASYASDDSQTTGRTTSSGGCARVRGDPR